MNEVQQSPSPNRDEEQPPPTLPPGANQGLPANIDMDSPLERDRDQVLHQATAAIEVRDQPPAIPGQNQISVTRTQTDQIIVMATPTIGLSEHLTNRNLMFGKPNITVLLAMLSFIGHAAGVFVAFNASPVSPQYLLLGYWVEQGLDTLALLFHLRTLAQPRRLLLLYLCRLLVVGTFTLDLFLQTRLSIYFVVLQLPYLVLLTPLSQDIPVSDYQFIPFCTKLILVIAETIVVCKYFGWSKDSNLYTSATGIVFYFILFTFLLNLGRFFEIVTLLCGSLCSCKSGAKMKVLLIAFLLELDHVANALVGFMVWTFVRAKEAEVRALFQNNGVITANDEIFERIQKDISTYSRALTTTSLVFLIYTGFKGLLIYYISVKLTAADMPLTMAGRRLAGNLGRTPQNPGGAAPPLRPRVERPSTTGRVLSLFRVNNNYFGGKAEGDSQVPSPEEDLCTICVANKPDCVVLECKHGGICKACMTEMMAKSRNCPLCRAPIAKVVVVEMIEPTQYKVLEEIVFE